MKRIYSILFIGLAVWLGLHPGFSAMTLAADTSKVDAASRRVERGAQGIGKGFTDMGKGIGHVVVEGAKVSGAAVQEAGEAAAPKVRQAGENVKEGATSFGQGVKRFLRGLFGG